jgi:hypothetical protein
MDENTKEIIEALRSHEQHVNVGQVDGDHDCLIASTYKEAADIIEKQDKNNAVLLAALKEARRAIGDHFAPNDCYATGPITGNYLRDLVECPACSAIAMYDEAVAKVARE